MLLAQAGDQLFDLISTFLSHLNAHFNELTELGGGPFYMYLGEAFAIQKGPTRECHHLNRK